MKFTKLLSLGQKLVEDGGGCAGINVANHLNFPSLVVSISEPPDVVILGGHQQHGTKIILTFLLFSTYPHFVLNRATSFFPTYVY